MILVVDIPDDWHCKEWCIEGDLMGKNEEGYWMFCNEIVEAPLKPIPEKEDPMRSKEGTYFRAYDTGWNDCLEEILNESNTSD